MVLPKFLQNLIDLSRSGDISRPLRRRLLGPMLYTIGALVILGLLASGGVMEAPPAVRIAQGAALSLLVAVWLLKQRDYVTAASHVLIWGFWIMATVVIISQNHQASYWLVPQFLVIILARFLINGRTAVSLAALTAVLDFSLYAFDLHTFMPPEWHELSLSSDWTAIGIGFLIILLIFYVADFVLRETLTQTNLTEDRFRFLFENTNDAIFIIRPDRTIANVNKTAAELLGYQPEELVGKPYADVVAPDQRDSLEKNFARLNEEGVSPLFERVLVCKDGSRRLLEFNAVAIKEKGRLVSYQGVARDLTDRKRLEEQLRHSLAEMETLAMQDGLTGLLNRRAITEHAEAEWHRAKREQRPMCVVLIDLDNLKDVNDSLGHLAGDRVISQLAEVIRTALRRYDWAGRWGGDEFMLVLPGANLMDAQEIAERLRSQYIPLIADIQTEPRPYLSIGIAVFSGRPGDEKNTSELFGQADKALYTAKQNGKNRVEVYRDGE